MKSLMLNVRMAFRRKAACLLVILFSMIATAFILAYPTLIYRTRNELEFAYDSVEVSGWLLNSGSYDDPVIEGDLWHALLDTGCISAHNTYATVEVKLFDAETLRAKTADAVSEETLKTAFAVLLAENADDKTKTNMRALNTVAANDDLLRQADEIQWLQGYSESCLSKNGLVCLLPEKLGYQPGDQIPVGVKNSENKMAVVCLQVVGIYPVNLSEAVGAILPVGTLEAVFSAEKWPFSVNGFTFWIRDNRDLPALKNTLIGMGLDGSDETRNIRAAIDDRILDGTVSPIESNLAMLEGLYPVLFVAVAVLGFSLCFLLARSRKPEYAVMRLLGESTMQVTFKALLEQAMLCLIGVMIGAVLLIAGKQGWPDPVICSAVLLCYTVGAAVAVLLTVQVNVMELLREKE